MNRLFSYGCNFSEKSSRINPAFIAQKEEHSSSQMFSMASKVINKRSCDRRRHNSKYVVLVGTLYRRFPLEKFCVL